MFNSSYLKGNKLPPHTQVQTNDLHVSTAPCLHENVIFRVLTHMLLLRTLSRSRSLHPNHSRDHCRLHVTYPSIHFHYAYGDSIPSVNPPRRLKPICQPNTEHHDKKARASERRQACDMEGLQCSRLGVATATKVVVAGERPDPGASSHHRIIGTMQAHLRSCTVPENNWCSGSRWVLAVRAAQIHEAFCVFDLGSHRGARYDCLRNNCARDLGILSIVIVVFIMEKEIRFFW